MAQDTTLKLSFDTGILRIAKPLAISALGTFTGVRLKKVTNRRRLADTKFIRNDVYYLEKGFLGPDSLIDQYDQDATIWNSYVGDDPAATLRITDSRKIRLEIYEMHPEVERLVGKNRRVLEVSRLMARREHRGFHATLPLFREVYRQMIETEAEGLIISCARGLIPYYRDIMGFKLLSPKPLTHANLRGLKDYAMLGTPTTTKRLTLAQNLGYLSIVGPSEFWKLKRIIRRLPA